MDTVPAYNLMSNICANFTNKDGVKKEKMTKKLDKSNIRGIIENNYIFGRKNPCGFHTVDIFIKGA